MHEPTPSGDFLGKTFPGKERFAMCSFLSTFHVENVFEIGYARVCFARKSVQLMHLFRVNNSRLILS